MEQTIVPIIFFVVFFSLILFILYLSFIQNKIKIEHFRTYAIQHNFVLVNDEMLQLQLIQSSFNKGNILICAHGNLPGSGNKLIFGYQSETRKRGKSSVTYNRTVVAVTIPDTQLHMIINSKLANDRASGGNLQWYSKQQRFTLEGDFGQFYDVFMPDKTQAETLTILTPDVMLILLKNLVYQDIEINGDTMYVYSYKHEKPAELARLIDEIDRAVSEMKLRPYDSRVEHGTSYLVARTATDASTTHRKLHKTQLSRVFIAAALIFAFVQFLPADIYVFIVPCIIFGGMLYAIIFSIRDRALLAKYNQFIRNRER